MSIVKAPSLAPSGRQKIQWVRDFMPALSGIEERFRREKPSRRAHARGEVRISVSGWVKRFPSATSPS